MGVILELGEFIKKINQAISDLKKGKFILIFDNDSREAETDLVIASEFVTSESIKTMRKDGGGLIFLMISKEIADKLHLPFLADMYSKIENRYPVLKKLVPDDIPYDAKSSFSLYVNHRKTFTGITDNDRSLTMKKFAELAKKLDNLNDELAKRDTVSMIVSSENFLAIINMKWIFFIILALFTLEWGFRKYLGGY